MLLSDRDIKAAIAEGRLGIEPYDAGLVQPSSIDVRLDRFFRVFNNSRYTHIDPAMQQDDLTTLVEPDGDEPFVLHPGEFVLGSTLEVVTIPDDLAARLEGKALALETAGPDPRRAGRPWASSRSGTRSSTRTGQPCRVVAATEVMLGRPCREVELSDGSLFIADAAHQWVTTSKQERRSGRPRTASVQDDRRDRPDARGTADELSHHIALAGAAQYPSAVLPIDPYVLGYWLGDGTSTKGEITVGAGDEEVLASFAAAGLHGLAGHGSREPTGWAGLPRHPGRGAPTMATRPVRRQRVPEQ